MTHSPHCAALAEAARIVSAVGDCHPVQPHHLCVPVPLGDLRALGAALAAYQPEPGGWRTMDSAPEGEHILLWFPQGERGIGGIEAATIYREPDGFAKWTHGGPNAGLDWETTNNEQPTHWMPLPPPPETK